jgi:predicted DNA-binding ribbon-helix-helix protein
LEGAPPPGIQPAAHVPGTADMKSSIVKRSIIIAGHKTSVSLEDAFWRVLKDIAAERDMTLSDLVGSIDSNRQRGNLSSAIRLFVLDFYREQISELEKRAATREVLGGATVQLPSKPGR